MQACAKSERQVRSCYHLQYLEEKEEGGKKKKHTKQTPQFVMLPKLQDFCFGVH